MFIHKKIPAQQRLPLSAAAQPQTLEPFEVDLREALASTSVSELSYEEFQRELEQHARLNPQ